MRRLSELRLGTTARISALSVDRTFTQRLMAIGVLPGTNVRLVQVAPLGDPLTFEVGGRFVSIRRKDASGIEISD